MKLYISKSESTGKRVVLNDMILTKNLPTTAGSKMLDGYMSLFDAEVVTKLEKSGYVIAGKANTGEMNIDLLGETSFYGACTDENGNLVNAAAEIVKSKDAQAAVCLDVNGSLVRGAALSGLTALKPTYGVVSRFGTVSAVCSGEAVGVMAESVAECKEIFSVIAGHDDKDGTSLAEEDCKKATEAGAPVRKIAVIKSFLDGIDAETKARIDAFKEKAKEVEFTEIDGNELLLAKSAWNTLMSAELCNNVSKYDGVKYGHRTENYTNIDELYTNSRTEAFGFLLKSTILYGSERLSTEKYMPSYDKALRIRRVICEYMEKLLSEYDAILLPACSKTSFSEEEARSNKYISYDESLYIAPAMITGLPALVAGGIQLIGKAFDDGRLLNLAETEGEF